MFEHYTFGVPARLEGQNTIHDVSPYDTSYNPSGASVSSPPISPSPHPPAPSAIADLLSKLEDSQLRRGSDDMSPSYPYGIPSPPADVDDDTPLEVDPHLDSKSEPSTPIIRPSSALKCRRLQRQLNTQLLCTRPQLQSINALVDEMVSSGQQCNVYAAPLSPAIPQTTTTSTSTTSAHASSSSSSSQPHFLASPPFIEAGSPSPSPRPQDNDDFDEGYFDAEPSDEVDLNLESLMMRIRSSHGGGPNGILKYTSSSSRPHGSRDVVKKPRMRKRIHVRKSD